MVARFVRDEEAVGSNPATPTGNRRDRLVPAIFYRSALLGLTTRCGVAPQISGHEARLISDTCTPRSPAATLRARLTSPDVIAVCALRGWGGRMWIGCAHPDRLCACG